MLGLQLTQKTMATETSATTKVEGLSKAVAGATGLADKRVKPQSTAPPGFAQVVTTMKSRCELVQFLTCTAAQDEQPCDSPTPDVVCLDEAHGWCVPTGPGARANVSEGEATGFLSALTDEIESDHFFGGLLCKFQFCGNEFATPPDRK